MKAPSLSKVLVVTVLLGSVLVWVAIYGVGLALMYWPASGGFDKQMRIFADGLAQVSEQDLDQDALQQSMLGINLVISRFAGDTPHNDAVGFNLWRADGQWAAGSPNVPRQRASSPGTEGFFDATLEGEDYRGFVRWTANRVYQIEVLHTARGRRTDFNAVMLSPVSIVAPLLVGLPMLLLPVLFVVRCGLKPLKKFSEALSARKPDDLTPIQTGDLVSELRPVVEEVNGTLGRLDALLKRERDFLADAAHELRTPLAVVSAQADEVLRAVSPEARTEAAAVLKAGLGRANRLVNQLLTLARLEAQADMEATDDDAADIVRECLAAYAQEARTRSIELIYQGPDHLAVGRAGHLFEGIVGNLVANAIRYGHAGGQVLVRMEPSCDGETWTLSVSDDGPGIPLEDRERIFERFRRGSQLGAAGSGLGLAIVASAARQAGAEIELGAGLEARGLSVRVSWPAKPCPRP
ncbi:ATP-binding protein [Nitrogeniibacter aestuarii]|uniref:ATP-binding protein n=1 Tax=Nitrogeniibacter aestuarii TaxID=2815343 RepID=UPI001E2CB61B|nr:ATP-binding protein [Nitrogeniibacter aestuarii]